MEISNPLSEYLSTRELYSRKLRVLTKDIWFIWALKYGMKQNLNWTNLLFIVFPSKNHWHFLYWRKRSYLEHGSLYSSPNCNLLSREQMQIQLACSPRCTTRWPSNRVYVFYWGTRRTGEDLICFLLSFRKVSGNLKWQNMRYWRKVPNEISILKELWVKRPDSSVTPWKKYA